jgi:osmotically-inducible protein OsmY
MENTTSIAEMLKFHFGSKVFCSDGEEGVLTHVAFDRGTRCLTSIGVKLGHLFGKTVYVPFHNVINATGEGVTLSITRADLATASQTAPGDALFDSRSVVQLADSSRRGTLFIIAVQPGTGKLGYIVSYHLRPGMGTLLRQEYITQIDSGHFTVSIPENTLQVLPPYRSDSELQREVEAILFDLTPLHVDFKGMTIRVLDSVLYLVGNISSSLRADVVRDQAMGVQGLLEIENHLVSDDTLAGDLAMALSRDSRTRDLPIGVYPRLGVVRLSGVVHNDQQKMAAEEIAKKFAGVRSVIDGLIVSANAHALNVMASAESGEAADIVPGKYIRHTK